MPKGGKDAFVSKVTFRRESDWVSKTKQMLKNMTKEQLKNGIIVCHMKYNRNYRIVSSHMRMKDSQKGWIDAVVYAPLYENEYECFSREIGSFLEEFVVVEG